MPKTLNDIIPPSRRREYVPPAEESEPEPPAHRPIRRSRPFPWGTVIVALIVIAISSAVLYFFSRAEVSITPKSAQASVNELFTAALSTASSTSALTYQVISVTKTETQSVAAETTETADVPAQGIITIYNEQPTAQKLIKNTRFASDTGLIFRIQDSVTIPAAKAGVPGSVTAKVNADVAGSNYNIGPSKFTVPGLKGGKSYTLVYAQSTAAMAGGFSGTRGAISKTSEQSARTTLDATLGTELATLLNAQIPDGAVLLPGAEAVTYSAVPSTAASTNSVSVEEQGTMHAIVFSEQAIAGAVAAKEVGQYQGEPVLFKDTKNLTLSYTSDQQPWVSGNTSFTFSLKGDTTLVWQVIPAKIAGAIAGKTRDSAQVVLTGGGFPEIGTARLILRPFWRDAFPEDPSAITVTVENR